jgi:hypothetical protein
MQQCIGKSIKNSVKQELNFGKGEGWQPVVVVYTLLTPFSAALLSTAVYAMMISTVYVSIACS